MPQAVAAAIAAFSTVATAATAILTGAGITGSIILDTAIALGASAGINALTTPNVKSAPAQLSVKVGAVQPRTMIMGTTAVAGLAATSSMFSGPKNGAGTFVRVLSGGGASGTIDKVLWDDEVLDVTVGESTMEYLASNRWISYKKGSWTQTYIDISGGAYGFPTGAQPSEWTSNHRCLGCMTVMMAVDLYGDYISANGIASKIAFVVNNTDAALTDPRTGTAATGAALLNPFVWAYSYAIGWYSPTGEKVGGGGLSTSNIHTASFSYAANVADTNSFTIAGELVLDDSEFLNNIRAIAQAGGGDITTRGGQLYATVAAARSVVYYVTEDDFRSVPSYRNALESSQVPNSVIPRFRSADNGYEIIDGSAVTDATFLSDDDGNAKVIPTTFPFCGGGATQAGKLAGLALVNAREQIAHSLPLKTQCRYKALVGDVVEYDTPNYRLDGVKISIESVTINNDLSVDWEAITETSSKYAWALGQTTTAPNMDIITLPDPTYVEPPDTSEWTPTAVTISGGSADLPIIQLDGAVVTPNGVSSVVPYLSVDSGTTWLPQTAIAPTETVVQLTGVTPATAYNVGMAYVNNYGVLSNITNLGTITTDAATIVAGLGDLAFENQVTAAGQIATNLISTYWTDDQASPITLTTPWQTILSRTITVPTGYQVQITGFAVVSGGTSTDVVLTKDNGTETDMQTYPFIGSSTPTCIPIFAVKSLAAGTWTFRWKAKNHNATNIISGSSWAISLIKT